MSASAEPTSVAPTSALERVRSPGPLSGLGGLIVAELRRWFPWRSLVFAAGGVAVLAFVRTVFVAEESSKLGFLLYTFFMLWAVLLVVTTVATAQGAVASEIDRGTAAWLLAKPIGRPAFVLAKFVAAVPAVLVAMVGVPGAAAWFVIRDAARHGDTQYSAGQVLAVLTRSDARVEFVPMPGLGDFLGLLALIAILLLFVLAIMILLGAVLSGRAAVFGVGLMIPLALVLVAALGPDAIVALTPAVVPSAIVALLQDSEATVLGPALVTTTWIAGALAAAVAAFSRREL